MGLETEKGLEISLDQRDGQVPSWSEISCQFRLIDLPPGEKRLFRSFYRAQRLFALGKHRKGSRLMGALDQLPYFVDFETENDALLGQIARVVRKK